MAPPPIVVGRYTLLDELASGGMASVHLGRLEGSAGFSRIVAIKRLHAQLAKDPEFAASFLDEARLVSRIAHRNVVPTLDVVALGGELLLVLEYVDGETLASLLACARAAGERLEPRVACAIVCGALDGLHAAHEAKDESGASLGVVHRDVSPQNILVASDGTPRVLDFGIAVALGRSQATRDGRIKGKLGYVAPEQLALERVDRATDVYAASVVLWEALTSRRLFDAENVVGAAERMRREPVAPPSSIAGSPLELDAIVARGLSLAPRDRFPSARAMSEALERAVGLASPREVAAALERLAAPRLAARRALVAAVEASFARVVDAAPSAGRASFEAANPSAIDDPGDDALTVALPDPSPRADTATPSALVASKKPVEPRRAWWLAPAGLASLIAVAAGVSLARSAGAPSAPSASPMAFSGAPAPESATAVVEPPAPASTPTASTPPPATAPEPRKDPLKAINQSPRRPCDNPYEVDARGVKRIKRECI